MYHFEYHHYRVSLAVLINSKMLSPSISMWIAEFFAARQLIQKKRRPHSNRLINSIKRVNLLSQTIALFQELIPQIIYDIGKTCRETSVLCTTTKFNQFHILKSFIGSRLLISSEWLFKYRKYYSSYSSPSNKLGYIKYTKRRDERNKEKKSLRHY